MNKYIISIINYALIYVVVWCILDFLNTTLIKHLPFQFDLWRNLGLPALFGAAIFMLKVLYYRKK